MRALERGNLARASISRCCGKSRAWKSREIALARWRGKRGERGREEEGDKSEHLEAAGIVCLASSVASPVPTGSARQRLCHSFGACFPPSSSPCLLFQSSSLPLFCLSFLCSVVWVVASVMHSALSFLCSFYSALLVACYLWLLWMQKSIFDFTADSTIASSSCVTGDYDSKTDPARKVMPR